MLCDKATLFLYSSVQYTVCLYVLCWAYCFDTFGPDIYWYYTINIQCYYYAINSVTVYLRTRGSPRVKLGRGRRSSAAAAIADSPFQKMAVALDVRLPYNDPVKVVLLVS